ncbi:MAG: type III pantothenate kinase [Pseudomonadales bacterium]|nr:type III pantothenate kinase [Pseudomonadales bacterium]
MSILLMDWGNTRLKWLMRSDLDQGARAQAACISEYGLPDAMNAMGQIERIWVSSVRSLADEVWLNQACWNRWGVIPEFARSEAFCAGVVNAYQEPGLLGVDRWMVLLAARHLCLGSVLVVDAGTAVTLDALDAQGRHLGGFILPGYELMLHALNQHTARINVSETAGWSGGFGSSTAEAVSGGAMQALLGALQRSHELFCRQTGETVSWLLTGGWGRRLAQGLGVSSLAVHEDLVLKGLSLWGASR